MIFVDGAFYESRSEATRVILRKGKCTSTTSIPLDEYTTQHIETWMVGTAEYFLGWKSEELATDKYDVCICNVGECIRTTDRVVLNGLAQRG